MRVLFTMIPFKAHVYNLVPLAWALRAAGHDVRVAGHPDASDFIVRAGLTAVPVGMPLNYAEQVSELRELQGEDDVDDLPFGSNALLRMDDPHPERLSYDSLHGIFTGLTAMLFQNFSTADIFDDLVGFARQWRPDLVIWDTLGFAGSVAARACGAAHARMLWGLDLVGRLREHYRDRMLQRPPELREDPLAEWLGWTLERYGCAFAEDLVVGQWTIDPMPSWLRFPVDHQYVPMRNIPYNGPAMVPGWLREPPKRRRVCLTRGISLRELMGGDRAPAEELLEAVADLDVEVVATFDERQLESVRRVPDNVRVVGFVPLNELLPTCSAIIHQGGTGTFQSALAHGVPQIVVPSDIWDNVLKAQLLEESGVGLCVTADQLSADALRQLLVRVLEEPSFAENAARRRTELLGTPAPGDIVPVLERLTAEHRVPR